MQVHTNKESCEKKDWRKLGLNRAETGLGRSASLEETGVEPGRNRPGPVSLGRLGQPILGPVLCPL
jgi:hypothetical protein